MKANTNRIKIKEKIPGVDSVIVSVDFTNGIDKSVLIVGRKNEKGIIDICHAVQGEEAEKLYYQLLGPEKSEEFKKEVERLREIPKVEATDDES
jgi:hypothetical protein